MRADATALPLRRGAVDVAVAALTLHHLDAGRGDGRLAEMTRGLRAWWW